MTKQGNGLDSGTFVYIAFSIGYGLLLSIPTFLIIYFLFPQLTKRIDKPIHLKIILTLIGIVSAVRADRFLLSKRTNNQLFVLTEQKIS